MQTGHAHKEKLIDKQASRRKARKGKKMRIRIQNIQQGDEGNYLQIRLGKIKQTFKNNSSKGI